MIKRFFLILFLILFPITISSDANADGGFVAILKMEMGIFPGTSEYLSDSIKSASNDGAKIVIVMLDTPGGILFSAQNMVKTIFDSPIPVIIYVAPAGAAATSAGVFITLAGHVAAMAPGTTIGSAHPVQGDGKDIEGDMREKAENLAISMVRAISEERKRNVAWAEKAVKESASVTDKMALQTGVVDIVADDVTDLLKRIKGKQVRVKGETLVLGDYSSLPRIDYDPGIKQQVLNVLANPMVAALLWLGATTGLALELYHPGAVLPGVVGVICLVLALAVNEVIPVSQSGVLLLVLGAVLIGAELFVPSFGILGIGGLISLVLGAIYLVDTSQAPELAAQLNYVIAAAILLGLGMMAVVAAVLKTYKNKVSTGKEGLEGQLGEALENFTTNGRVFVQGETWKATCAEGLVEKGMKVRVKLLKPGLVLEVEKISEPVN